MGGIMLLIVLCTTISFQSSRKLLRSLAILAWPVATRDQRIYSAVPAAESEPPNPMADADPVGWNYYQKVYNFADSKRGLESGADRYDGAYYEFPYNFNKTAERGHCRLGQRQ